MNLDKERKLLELSRRSPFAICFVLFLLLAADYGFRLVNLVDQRAQLNQALLLQAQNAGTLAQARQLETRLEALSLELLQVAKTNPAARKIVQEFNIQWTPGPAGPGPAPTQGRQKK